MCRILLAEDNDNLREVMTDYLEDNGFQVTAVPNGAEKAYAVGIIPESLSPEHFLTEDDIVCQKVEVTSFKIKELDPMKSIGFCQVHCLAKACFIRPDRAMFARSYKHNICY